MHRKQATIIVNRLMGKAEDGFKTVPTLINTDRIVSANDDESGDFTWLRYVVDARQAGTRDTWQNWKVLESLDELLRLTNALVPEQATVQPEALEG